MKYLVWRPEHGQTIVDAAEIEYLGDPSLAEVAERAAEIYHDQGGYEASWPLKFVVAYGDRNIVLGEVEVDRVTVPAFFGTVLNEIGDSRIDEDETEGDEHA
jgi:hypothetical protein